MNYLAEDNELNREEWERVLERDKEEDEELPDFGDTDLND